MSIDNITPLIPFSQLETIFPGNINISPDIFGTTIEDDVSRGTKMRLDKPNSPTRLKFISNESSIAETIEIIGLSSPIGNDLELQPEGFAFLMYQEVNNDGLRISSWKIIGGKEIDIL